MSPLDKRLTKLEQDRPLVVDRPEGEPFDEFIRRLILAAEVAPIDQFETVLKPWIAAIRSDEVGHMPDFIRAIDAEQERRRGQSL